MRAIIRFSINNESNSALRNRLAVILAEVGLIKGANTATYESINISEADLSRAVQGFWAEAAAHNGPGRLDHFWMYSEQTALDAIHPPAEAA